MDRSRPLRARRSTARILLVTGVTLGLALVPELPCQASSWVVGGLSAATAAQAHSSAAPAAPSSITAACASSSTEVADLSWAAVAHATSYQVVQATTATGSYTASATQPVGTATTVAITYTTSVSYYYKLYALIGTTWKSAVSANATVGSTTPGFLAFASSGTRCTPN